MMINTARPEPGQLVRLSALWDGMIRTNSRHRTGDIGLLIGDDPDFRNNVVVIINGTTLKADITYFEVFDGKPV